MKALRTLRRSKTLLFSVALAVLGVLEQSRGVLEPLLKDYAGVTFVAIAALVAVLRILTTQSLADKAGPQP
jgi:hypothetical protein